MLLEHGGQVEKNGAETLIFELADKKSFRQIKQDVHMHKRMEFQVLLQYKWTEKVIGVGQG